MCARDGQRVDAPYGTCDERGGGGTRVEDAVDDVIESGHALRIDGRPVVARKRRALEDLQRVDARRRLIAAAAVEEVDRAHLGLVRLRLADPGRLVRNGRVALPHAEQVLDVRHGGHDGVVAAVEGPEDGGEEPRIVAPGVADDALLLRCRRQVREVHQEFRVHRRRIERVQVLASVRLNILDHRVARRQQSRRRVVSDKHPERAHARTHRHHEFFHELILCLVECKIIS